MTTHLDIPPEIQEILNYERYHHPVPLVQRRMEVLWLKSLELSHDLIAKAAGITANTMREYFALYAEGGVEKLKEVHYFCPQSQLTGHIMSLEAYFQANPPASIKAAQREIERLTGIKRSETQVREFLKKNYSCVAGKSG